MNTKEKKKKKKNLRIIQEMGMPDHLTSLLRNLYACQEPDVEQWTGSKLGKEYIKAVLKTFESP